MVKVALKYLKVLVVQIKTIRHLLFLRMSLVHLELQKNQYNSNSLVLQFLPDPQFIREGDPYLDLVELQILYHSAQMIQKNYLKSVEVHQRKILNLMLEQVQFSPSLVLHIQDHQDQKKLQVYSILMVLHLKHLQKQIMMDWVPSSQIYNPNQEHHSHQNQPQHYSSLLDQVKKEIQKHIMDLDLLESLSVQEDPYSMIIRYHKKRLEFLEILLNLLENQITMVLLTVLLQDYQKIRREIIFRPREPGYSSYNIPI